MDEDKTTVYGTAFSVFSVFGIFLFQEGIPVLNIINNKPYQHIKSQRGYSKILLTKPSKTLTCSLFGTSRPRHQYCTVPPPWHSRLIWHYMTWWHMIIRKNVYRGSFLCPVRYSASCSAPLQNTEFDRHHLGEPYHKAVNFFTTIDFNRLLFSE
jgi:hypothetical protein